MCRPASVPFACLDVPAVACGCWARRPVVSLQGQCSSILSKAAQATKGWREKHSGEHNMRGFCNCVIASCGYSYTPCSRVFASAALQVHPASLQLIAGLRLHSWLHSSAALVGTAGLIRPAVEIRAGHLGNAGGRQAGCSSASVSNCAPVVCMPQHTYSCPEGTAEPHRMK